MKGKKSFGKMCQSGTFRMVEIESKTLTKNDELSKKRRSCDKLKSNRHTKENVGEKIKFENLASINCH